MRILLFQVNYVLIHADHCFEALNINRKLLQSYDEDIK